MSLMDFFRKKPSGQQAVDRLKLVLVSDRANCSPEIMEQIKNDIIQVISKYVEYRGTLPRDVPLFVWCRINLIQL